MTPQAVRGKPGIGAIRRSYILGRLSSGAKTIKELVIDLSRTPYDAGRKTVTDALHALIDQDRVACVGRDTSRKGHPLVFALAADLSEVL